MARKLNEGLHELSSHASTFEPCIISVPVLATSELREHYLPEVKVAFGPLKGLFTTDYMVEMKKWELEGPFLFPRPLSLLHIWRSDAGLM